MKWILIVAFVTSKSTVSSGQMHGFEFQEFDSKETCESAISESKRLVRKLNGSEYDYTFSCVKK